MRRREAGKMEAFYKVGGEKIKKKKDLELIL